MINLAWEDEDALLSIDLDNDVFQNELLLKIEIAQFD